MERDIIILVEGGAMLGVFGAGVVSAFQEADIYNRVYSVYGVSAGAHDLAYFLSRQTRLGSSIYYEDLASHNFVRPGLFFSYIWDVIGRHFQPKRPIRHLLDLDFLVNVEENIKRMDIEEIARQPIPFHVAAYDFERRDVVFLDGKQDTLQTLKASSAVPPFYGEKVTVRGREYLDGGLLQNWDVGEIVRQHQDKKILYVVNNKKTYWFTLLVMPYYLFEAALNVLVFGWRIGWKRFINAFSYKTEKQLLQFHNVKVVSNSLQMTNSVTNKKKLLKIFEHGFQKGKVALLELGIA